MKEMLKDALILFLITLVAGGILGVAYTVTKDPIKAQEEKAKTDAYIEVFEKADHFEVLNDFDGALVQTLLNDNELQEQEITEVMKALDASDNLLGYVITVVSGEGYSGDIIFSMGVSLDGTLNGISLLTIAETPGLGMKADDILVPQFSNKKVSQFTYTKTGATIDSQIDAISGATITTRAITNGVNAGLLYFQTFLEGGSSNE